MSPRFFWSLGAWSERRAFWTTIKVREPELFDRRSRELAERLMPWMTPDAVVLDIGCGIGRPERYLAPSARQIVGADISRRMLTLARRRHRDVPNVSWRLIDGSSFRFAAPDTFDFAFCEQVLQHVERHRVVRLLADLLRVLKPGGKAHLQFLNLESPYNRRAFVSNALRGSFTPADLRYWTVPEVTAVADEIGFMVEGISVENDFRGPDGSIPDDELHRDYSIWLTVQKPAGTSSEPGTRA